MKKNILVIGAHFDDIEIGCGGTVAKHISNQDNVIMLVLTHSGYRNYHGEVIRTSKEAKKEGLLAAKILGVNNIISIPLETKEVQYGTELIEIINKVIDENNIDVIYTHWDKDVNQDHNAIGRATLTAGRNINNIFMYKSNRYITSSTFNGNYFIDISEFIDIKVSAIKAHEGEYAKFGKKWLDFFINDNMNSGITIGVKYAESFEVVKCCI
jgi:LmbE family N-acetylglucosaminyl deacetylase